MKNFFYFLLCACLFTPFFTACEESEGVDEYAGWQARNEAYIDSIAKVARANEGTQPGQWKIMKSYLLAPDQFGAPPSSAQDYVYAQIQTVGTGVGPVVYTDSIGMSYRGKLIDGTVFAQNYAGDNDITDVVPIGYRLNKSAVLGVGWVTALQYMHVGDIWNLYIPSQLGYGATTVTSPFNVSQLVTVKQSIRGYSSLVVNVYLAYIIPL